MDIPRQERETGPVESVESAIDFEVDQIHSDAGVYVPQLSSDRYRVCELIEHGGMGVIYRARDQMLHRDVAIKILRTDRVSNPTAPAEFVKEAHIMSFLSHPGVTPIYETGMSLDGRPFHVMKLVDGTTLAAMLRDDSVGTSELLQVFADVCQTMAFAHSHGIIHLDLKPSNVMVGAFGEVNVMDWGLAQQCDASGASRQAQGHSEGATPSQRSRDRDASTETEIRQSSVNGTPEYMSPEQARGESLDARADVFSLGGILCEILSGHAPYEGSTLRQVFRSAFAGKTDPILNKLRTCGLDDALIRLTINCLQLEVNDRPRSAVVLAQAIMAHQASTLELAQSDMNRFFELSLDLFCIADQEGYFLRINSNFSKVLGHSEDDLLAQPFLHFVHVEDRDRTIQRMSVLNQGKPVVRFRNRYQTAAGDYVTLEWTAKSIEDEGLIFAVARDVTDEIG